jgi:methionyl-tRNA formyltransferase
MSQRNVPTVPSHDRGAVTVQEEAQIAQKTSSKQLLDELQQLLDVLQQLLEELQQLLDELQQLLDELQ